MSVRVPGESKFRGDKIYQRVPGCKQSVYRIFFWVPEKMRYFPPPRGNQFFARRTESRDGQSIRRSRSFEFFNDARAWASGRIEAPDPTGTLGVLSDNCTPVAGPTFREAIDHWRKHELPNHGAGTRCRYENIIRLYFDSLLDRPVRSINVAVVDEWLLWLKENINRFGKAKLRKSFHHELTLLRTILNSYRESFEDLQFAVPVLRKHIKRCRVASPRPESKKDLSLEEFRQVVAELKSFDLHPDLWILATVQYFHALRISEVAALDWSAVEFNSASPKDSRLHFNKHVVYVRGPTGAQFIEAGLKNEPKTHFMHPEVFAILLGMQSRASEGLVFKNPEGLFFTYRQIQYAFNRAYKRLGLKNRSTHVLRHAGTHHALDLTNGDRDIGRQILGNKDARTVEIYAKRPGDVLRRYMEARWASASVAPIGGLLT